MASRATARKAIPAYKKLPVRSQTRLCAPGHRRAAHTPADPPERGLWLRDALPKGSADAFINEREIGHFHPWDQSMHIALPPDLAPRAVDAGWAEVHPVARAGLARKNNVMLYGPRDEHEADVIYGIVLAAYEYAGGKVP